MSELQTLKTKIEAELKSKTPSASKILFEVEKVYNEKIKEMERLATRCKYLEKKEKQQRYSTPKFETQRPNRPSYGKKEPY